MNMRIGVLLATILFGFMLSACDGGSPPPSPPPPAAAPTISSISPDPVIGSTCQQPITVTGTGFDSNVTATLTWTGQSGYALDAGQIHQQSDTEVVLRINTSVESDEWSVTMTNPDDGQSSNQMTFSVIDSPEPNIVDGFDYPFGNKERYTDKFDSDGWYIPDEEVGVPDSDFNTPNSAGYHLGEDWNIEEDPDPSDIYSGPDRDFGRTIYAIANGTIVMARTADVPGWGNVLVIRHKMPDGSFVESVYGHVGSFIRTEGDVVRGEPVATVGKRDPNAAADYDPATAKDDPAHLHLELRFQQNASVWGCEGPGYSDTPLSNFDTRQSPYGWTDPSDFIDAHRPSLTIIDGDFASWSPFSIVNDDPGVALPGPGTSTGTATTMASGGNPDAYMATTTTIFEGDILATGAVKDDYELCNAGTGPDLPKVSYDPAKGAIEMLVFSAEVAMLSAGHSSMQLVVEQESTIGEQGGTKYYSQVPFPFVGGWANKGQWFATGPDHFDTTPRATEPFNKPDFSINGEELKFGLVVGNSLSSTTGTTNHGIDNFRVTIVRSAMFTESVECPRTTQPD